ncbi:regulatory protein N domain protein [Hafnia alvei ATCC 51873]|uniref:Regulatory protein N domain protein n=1 Tax=Hafnia alvei ATCC 51873 TaxID=1002364 RepID=G9Y736_HAFAL|nr:regulatory protein N domain protein [Hafnia alvei ATCC 51873]
MAKVSVQLKAASMRIATYHTTKALTEDVNMNSRQRYKAKRAAENRERNLYLTKIDKAYTKLSMGLSGCSERTVKALSLPTPVVRGEEEVTGSYCLPQVAIFAAGHRKSGSVTAR